MLVDTTVYLEGRVGKFDLVKEQRVGLYVLEIMVDSDGWLGLKLERI